MQRVIYLKTVFRFFCLFFLTIRISCRFVKDAINLIMSRRSPMVHLVKWEQIVLIKNTPTSTSNVTTKLPQSNERAINGTVKSILRQNN